MNLKEYLKYLKLHESTVSGILGVIVVLFSGILLARYLTKHDTIKPASLNLGNVTPNLTEAYPEEKSNNTFVSPTPTTKVNLNNIENTSSTSTEAETYTVAKGDTLWQIAEVKYRSGYNWKDIADANKLSDPGKIEVGQKLFIPNVNAKIIAKSEIKQENTANAIDESSYTVVKGDSLWSISVRAYGDGYKWREIARENKLMSPNIIHSGNVLTIPR